jgi:hypothetical protein
MVNCKLCGSVRIVTRLDGRRIRVKFLAQVKIFSPLHSVQTGSGAHPASHLVTALRMTAAVPLSARRPRLIEGCCVNPCLKCRSFETCGNFKHC